MYDQAVITGWLYGMQEIAVELPEQVQGSSTTSKTIDTLIVPCGQLSKTLIALSPRVAVWWVRKHRLVRSVKEYCFGVLDRVAIHVVIIRAYR